MYFQEEKENSKVLSVLIPEFIPPQEQLMIWPQEN